MVVLKMKLKITMKTEMPNLVTDKAVFPKIQSWHTLPLMVSLVLVTVEYSRRKAEV